jgi:hypothetical protein
MPASTLLSLVGSGFELSDYSLRGLSASLMPIDQSANVQRDINGNARDFSLGQFRKYKVRITCTDQESPGFAAISTSDPESVWPGSLVTVTLVPQLGSPTALTLNMIVSSPWAESRDEWAAATEWTLELEEV